MANSIGDAIEKVTTRLDKIIEQEATTSFLNMNQDLLGEYRGDGVIDIPSITMSGLGDYDRALGFPQGDISLTFEPYQMKFDRGRQFDIDNVDDEERALIISSNLMAEFARTKVIPEVDAIRYARLAENAGESVAETFTSAEATANSVITAEEFLQDHGKMLSECTLCLSSKTKTLLRKAQKYEGSWGQAPNTNFVTFDEMKLNPVSGDRFFTAIETLDGTTTGEEAGGYRKAVAKYAKTEDTAVVDGKDYYTLSGSTYTKVASPQTASIATYYEKVSDDGYPINFIAVHPEAAAALQKHNAIRHFAPEVNQKKDAHLFQYRLYHDLLVMLQKKGLIYVSYAI